MLLSELKVWSTFAKNQKNLYLLTQKFILFFKSACAYLLLQVAPTVLRENIIEKWKAGG
jgi:hypothetical protein